MTQPSGSKLPALTGIRIFAALAVYMSHIGAPAGSPRLITTFFEAGYAGVTLFFVLSGFVLTLNYFDGFRHLNPRAGYDYFVARFARIYPPYVLVLFCLVVLDYASGQSIEGWWRNALAIQAWDPNLAHAYSFDGPSWSISVEFFLYACFPLLVPLLARPRHPHTTLVVAIGVAAGMLAIAALFAVTGRSGLPWEDPGSAHRWLYRMPLTRLGDFTLGILAARLYIQTQGREVVKGLGSPLALGAAIVGLGLMVWPGLLFSSWSWDVAYAIPAAAFIFGLAVAPQGLPARVLSLSFLVLLGEASYAFYLVHAPVIDFLGGGQWGDSASITAVVLEGLMLGLILAMAVGLYMTFERPARTYIRRVLLTRRIPSKPTADPVPP
jgi:peptidoglycan/LPS O-acetylase OafA/YrhL